MFVFALFTISVEAFERFIGLPEGMNSGRFILLLIVMFFFFASVERLLALIVTNKWTPFFSLVPASLILVLLLRNNRFGFISCAVIAAFAIRIIMDYLPGREKWMLPGIVVLDGVAIFQRLYWNFFSDHKLVEKLLFVALAVLTVSAIQQVVFGKKHGVFPFHYFLLLGAIAIFLPMKAEPIDWSKIQETVGNIAGNATYYMGAIIGSNGYTIGYGSLDVKGTKLSKSDKSQLILTTAERPYFVYTDSETGTKMKMRRTVYLAGGKGIDGAQLVDWLQFLYDNDIDAEEAAVFSQISKVDIEYVFLDTKDEIAPAGTIVMSNEDGNIKNGKSSSRHKKGYRLKTKYLDVDYGSPYLINLFINQRSIHKDKLNYQQAKIYFNKLYNQQLEDVITKEEFENICNHDNLRNDYSELLNDEEKKDYLSVAGVSAKMKELAQKLTANCSTDYEKARVIETYLRQYKYSTNAKGGYDSNSNMSTANGMADIADRFLFDTKQGYCVHFTSSMIMLLRSVGIPARPVLGFRYSFPFDTQEEYVVEANQAHVWPEVYIANVGWVPFEPTSSYATSEEYSWHRLPAEELEQQKTTEELESGLDLALPENLVIENQEDGSEDSLSSENQIGINIIKIIGLVLISIILLVAFIIIGSILIRKIKYYYATPEDKVKMDVETIKLCLEKQFGNQLTDRGLLTDYAEFAPDYLKDDLKRTFRVYYRIMYGDINAYPVTIEESFEAREIRDYLANKKA